jgi:hypothetical protein
VSAAIAVIKIQDLSIFVVESDEERKKSFKDSCARRVDYSGGRENVEQHPDTFLGMN